MKYRIWDKDSKTFLKEENGMFVYKKKRCDVGFFLNHCHSFDVNIGSSRLSDDFERLSSTEIYSGDLVAASKIHPSEDEDGQFTVETLFGVVKLEHSVGLDFSIVGIHIGEGDDPPENSLCNSSDYCKKTYCLSLRYFEEVELMGNYYEEKYFKYFKKKKPK